MNKPKWFFIFSLIVFIAACVNLGLTIRHQFAALEQRVQKIEESIRK